MNIFEDDNQDLNIRKDPVEERVKKSKSDFKVDMGLFLSALVRHEKKLDRKTLKLLDDIRKNWVILDIHWDRL